MNVSRVEQRTLHALAQGGRIVVARDGARFTRAECFDREGRLLVDCTLSTFRRLKRRGFVMSINGGPYFITRAGLAAVRAQLDNR